MTQHRAYQPLLPAGNKYLQQKWDKASYDLHRNNVKTAKPTINMTAPETYGHLALKLKKQKLEEEWNMKIQRENNLLLEKMARIIQTTGAVDNKNYYEKKSLNMQQRQMELLRISHENQLMLQRLSQCKPHYNVKSWHEDWVKNVQMIDSIARYPRGRANTLKGQEKPKISDLGKDKMIRGAKTKGSHTNKESKNIENKKETNMEDTTRNLEEQENPDLELKDSTSDIKKNIPIEQEEG